METAAINEPSGPTRLLNISEVANKLGVDVRHVRRLVHEKRIPYIKWGHLLRFDPATGRHAHAQRNPRAHGGRHANSRTVFDRIRSI